MVRVVLKAISLPPFWRPRRARQHDRSRSYVGLQSWSVPLPSSIALPCGAASPLGASPTGPCSPQAYCGS
jgi:hypothetical protein